MHATGEKSRKWRRKNERRRPSDARTAPPSQDKDPGRNQVFVLLGGRVKPEIVFSGLHLLGDDAAI